MLRKKTGNIGLKLNQDDEIISNTLEARTFYAIFAVSELVHKQENNIKFKVSIN